MDTTGVWFLGVIAVASLVQAGFLVAFAMGGLKLFRRLDELQARLDREWKPALDQITRISRNVAEVSDLATLQARRIDLFVGDTVDKLEGVTANVQHMLLRPLGPLADLTALIKGLRKGIEVYRELGSHDAVRGRVIPRRSHVEDDEHLFI
jgi:hypothetical protein